MKMEDRVEIHEDGTDTERRATTSQNGSGDAEVIATDGAEHKQQDNGTTNNGADSTENDANTRGVYNYIIIMGLSHGNVLADIWKTLAYTRPTLCIR